MYSGRTDGWKHNVVGRRWMNDTHDDDPVGGQNDEVRNQERYLCPKIRMLVPENKSACVRK